jgi:hypothetical protein
MQQSFAAWYFLKTTAAELTSIKVDLCGVRSSSLHTSIFQDGPSHAAIGSLARLAAHRLIVFVLPQIPSLIVQLRAPSTQVNQITPTGHQPIFEKLCGGSCCIATCGLFGLRHTQRLCRAGFMTTL